MKWLDSEQIEVEPPKRPKRITGTRFASILGLDRWNTPFKTWCAITRTYEEPFEDNKYTIAGKTIEPKVINYLNKVYYQGHLKSPTDIYGEDYFRKTWGNFFPESDIFGGMWDALLYDENGKVDSVIEIKTTGRVEDWVDGAPPHYALQASLYAYLLGIDNVVMVASFLEDKDYEHPEDFEPSVSNTIVDEFKVSERYPQFQKFIDFAREWWNKHVVTGISPDFDESKDSEVLKELRKNVIDTEDSLNVAIAEAEGLKLKVEKHKEAIKDDEKRLKELTALIRSHCAKQFREGDKQVVIEGSNYDWVLSRSTSTKIDEDALKRDGLYEKYSVPTENLRFTQKKRN
jgi:predicted phage-related endonuclease